MDFQRGLVVFSKAGRDKGGYFAVLSVEGATAVVADGRTHALEHPKRKNLRHMQVTNTVLEEQAFISNKQLHKVLREKGFCKEADPAHETQKGGQALV